MSKMINVADRTEKELVRLERAIKKLLATNQGGWVNIGDVRYGETCDGMHWVDIDNDGKIGDLIAREIDKSQFASVRRIDEFEGTYDWSSDSYSRPCSVVYFTI